MHELAKDLYGYSPESENEVVRLKVYPNPSHDLVNISYTNYLLKEAFFNLYDLTGRIVKTKKYAPQNEGTQKFKLNISHLKPGTYFYSLQIGEKKQHGKVVKIEN